MRRLNDHQGRTLRLALFTIILAAFAAGAFAAVPVTVAVAVSGDPAPGATVTAKATVTTTDGSAVQSIKWTQVGGVAATLSNTNTDTITIVLPARKVFREHLIEILEEPPLNGGTAPPKFDPETYEGGLQNRFTVVGISPLAAEHAVALSFKITVTTSSGTYDVPASVDANLHFPWSTGLRNTPILVPVLLHGKTQASYDWTLSGPAGSKATLVDATTQNPEFTPDLPGAYKLTVTDLAAGKPVELSLWAGTWKGMVAGLDANGRPAIDAACTSCHVPGTPTFDLFTPWKASGHAEIFNDNVNNPTGHYSESCVSCHTVGYDKAVANGGFDDASDFAGLVASGMLSHGAVDNAKNISAQFPNAFKMTGIQCENCHGPQSAEAGHAKKDGSRATQSSDLCGTCHGEPARHGRFQQWQLSRHANYELAGEEGTNTTCAKCHSSQGYIQWADKGFSTAPLTITWKQEDVHPITCAACHDPHAVGTTSGSPNSNATVRVSGETPMLDAGFKATNVGRGAVCMTCHNSRRGLRDDQHFNKADMSRASHLGPQTDILMGQNLYFAEVGNRSNHANVEDACVTCHMESSPPPASLSYNLAGTNHTFFASPAICAKCHTSINLAQVQEPVEAKLEALHHEIQTALKVIMQNQIRLGNAIDLGGQKTVRGANDIAAVEYIESHGRQGASVTLSDGTVISDMALNSIKVVRPAGAAVEILAVADPSLAKAGWNYWMVHSDGSKGVHNPTFVNGALDVSLFAVKAIVAANTTPPVGGVNPYVGGGTGSGEGAISCTTPYVYWSEIAAHAPGGAGSEWRTDLVARNLGTSTANLKFILHQASGELTGNGAVTGSAQKAFEDIVLALGGDNTKGSLEICSDQPLMVMSRVFSQSPDGTFGQALDGHVANLGYVAGDTVSLIGLRQKSGAFRSNLSVTNGGKTEAEVAINLFDAAGTKVHGYTLIVPAGQVVQDVEPFRIRANAPDLDWGFATVTVVKGTNIQTSASMVDMKTNDPTTIPAKQ